MSFACGNLRLILWIPKQNPEQMEQEIKLFLKKVQVAASILTKRKRGFSQALLVERARELWMELMNQRSYGSSEGICGVGATRGGHKAGKSTLLHCLAGIEPVSSGDALVCGASVRYGYLHRRNRIGFCPQYEAMYMSMTVREHLRLHAVLKGLAEPQSLAVETALQAMQRSDVADTRIEICKAGTKCMLSLAVALLGSPRVLMLDEPSSGMDFSRRKRAWKHISAQSNHCATLICTQSFEEASVLGTRVGIIVGGQHKCVGDILFCWAF